MPSKRSKSVVAGTGNAMSVTATEPVPHCTMFAAGTGVVLLFVALIVVWLKRSRAKPVTRTTWPTLTRSVAPVNTKMPSDVAGSASPTRSWM